MNRPQRKSGGVMKKLFVPLCLLLMIGGGGYAVWRLGLIGQAWEKAHGAVSGLLNRGGGEEAAVSAAAPSGAALDAGAANPRSESLRPQSAAAQPVPAPKGSIDVASQANSAPRQMQAASAVSAPAAASVPASPAGQAAPQAVRARSSEGVSAAGTQAAAAGAAVVPALSEARMQLRAIDQMLASDPAEAMRRVEALMASRLEADDAAEAGYRLGYAARLLRDEAKAEKSWKEAAEKYPNARGGRFSALALADTWYHHYAGDRPQLSYWDDIQIMYSRALGADDAPFLPAETRAVIKERLNRLNDSLFFGSAPSKLARYHKVESGELLGSIANKYRVDYESIARINGINPNRIRAGMDLKLLVGEVSVIVRKNAANPEIGPTVTWFIDGRWAREYPACVGDGNKTPAGSYQLTSKERDPSWTNPVNGQLLPNDHPENILGSRWMAMKGMNTQGLGIHGTTVDDSVPGYTSAGCVRLLNRDVEELFSYARIGGKVTVLE